MNNQDQGAEIERNLDEITERSIAVNLDELLLNRRKMADGKGVPHNNSSFELVYKPLDSAGC